ncbi:MAG: tetratricopeptide repeat protein, partial [Armatimonadota bacterium]
YVFVNYLLISFHLPIINLKIQILLIILICVSEMRRKNAVYTNKKKLTACVVIEKKSKHISNTLKKILDIADELILAVKLNDLQNYILEIPSNCKIIEFQSFSNISHIRNRCITHSKSDWIIFLEPDEELANNSIIQHINSLGNSDVQALSVIIKQPILNENSNDFYTYRHVPIVRKDISCEFRGSVVPDIDEPLYEQNKLVIDSNIYINKHTTKKEVESKLASDESIKKLTKDFNKYPNSIVFAYALAKAHCIAKNHNECDYFLSTTADKITSNNPIAKEFYARYIYCKNSIYEYQKALEISVTADKLGLRHPEIYYNRAISLLKLERYEEAIADFELARLTSNANIYIGDQSIKSYKALLGIAEAQMLMGNYEGAIESAKTLLKSRNDIYKAKELIGNCYFYLGEFEKAEKIFKDLIEENYIECGLNRLISLYKIQDKNKDIIDLFESIGSILPNDSNIHCIIADCANSIGNFEIAESEYKKAIESQNDMGIAYAKLARIMMSEQRYNEAVNILKDGMNADNNCPELLFQYGDLMYILMKYSEAIGAYQKALLINPDNLLGFIRLGNCFLMTGAFECAALAFSQALVIDSNNPEARNGLLISESNIKNSEVA